MIRSFIKNRKYLLAFLACVTLIVSILLGCKKEEYDNPYDSKVPAASWAPYDLTAFQTSLKTVVLRWTQLDLRIDSFCIEAKRGQGEWTVIGYSDKNTHTFIDTALIPDPTETQVYRVHALAWKNNSIYAINSIKPTFTKPNAPFVTKAFGVKIKLTWFDNYKNEDNYKIEKKVEGGNWVLCSDTIGGNSELYYDSTPELNTLIMYRLSVKAAGFYSDTTQSHKISTLIAPPTWFFIASLSQTSCRIEWKQGDSWTTGYNVDRQFGNEPWQDGWLKLDSAVTSFTDNNILTDQDVRYRVGTIVNNSFSTKTELIYGLAVMDSISTSNTSYTSITVKTSVKSEPGTPVSEWGIVYGTSPNPTITDTKCTALTAGNIVFTSNLTGLVNNKTYYIRPYAINRRGASYGKLKIFTLVPNSIPQLDNVNFSSVWYVYSDVSSNILSDGGLPIIEAGFVYSTTPGPTIDDKKNNTTYQASPTGIYHLSSFLNNLTNGVTYYVRSFARNSLGLSYGPEKTLNLLRYTLPVIDTLTIKSVEAARVQLSCYMRNAGGGGSTLRGFVYGVTVNPTVTDNIWTDQSNYNLSTYYSTYFTGLLPNQTYHARAYIQNLAGIVYSPDKIFTTLGISEPILVATNISSINYTTAIITGQVKSDGGNTIIEAGFLYSTSPDPTINDNKIICVLNAPDYIMNKVLSPLLEGETYYVKSYARNSIGNTYSPVVKFTMKPYTLPIMQNLVQAYNIGTTTAQLVSNVLSIGGDKLAESGFVYGDNPGPTISDNKQLANTGWVTNTYCTLTNLQNSHKYYVRSYVKNTKGISYSSEITFTTKL